MCNEIPVESFTYFDLKKQALKNRWFKNLLLFCRDDSFWSGWSVNIVNLYYL